MLLASAHSDGVSLVHLTHTTLVHEGLCGEPVTNHGDPDRAIVCEECLVVAVELGEDVSAWYRVTEEPIEFLIAA